LLKGATILLPLIYTLTRRASGLEICPMLVADIGDVET
jgi:hypothetical protein